MTASTVRPSAPIPNIGLTSLEFGITKLISTAVAVAAPPAAPPQPAGGGGGPPPGAVQIRLTQEEGDAIDRLQQLGFPREAAVQAYLAADKNEDLAANLLFDGTFD
mmetsp:Transcript_14371/g.38023  ORF Transcript_14371/g.38023 Transcript_14371/m.38023 type:complete len:106 (+) Transcript_14371:1065-1382(+)